MHCVDVCGCVCVCLRLWSSPEDGHHGGEDRVSVVDIHVIPAALCGKVVEAQPQNRVRTGRIERDQP